MDAAVCGRRTCGVGNTSAAMVIQDWEADFETRLSELTFKHGIGDEFFGGLEGESNLI
jgi:hypothetical protein